jgi:hypothetical protein
MRNTTKAAIKKYTEQVCVECFNLYNENSMGAKSIGEKFNLTTRQADAAISAGRELITMKSLKLVPDFFTKATQEIDKTYFPGLKYYRDDNNCAAVHFALERHSNGVLGYEMLIEELSKSCNDSKENIHAVISKFVLDFGDVDFDPSLPVIVKPKWPASMYNKNKK